LREQRRKIGEIPDAPVALRAHRVELRRSAPDATVVLHRERAKAQSGDDDQGRFADHGAIAQDRKAMVAAGRGDRQRELARGKPFTVQVRGFGDGQRGRIDHAFMALAVFLREPPRERRIRVGGRKVQAQ